MNKHTVCLRWLTGGAILAAICCGTPIRSTAANELANASFETPDASAGDVADAPGGPWIGFGDPSNRFTTRFVARSGVQSVKTFGPFDFTGGGIGGAQKVSAMENQLYEGSIFAYNASVDPISGEDFGVFKLEFLDADMEFVGGNGPAAGFNVVESPLITAASPRDEWIELATSGVSPPGTEFVQAVLVKVQLGDPSDGGFNGGSIFWDDARIVKVIPEPGAALLAVLVLCGVLRGRMPSGSLAA